MRNLGISEEGFSRLARVTGQAANWQSRFNDASGAAEQAPGQAGSIDGVNAAEIQQWIDYLEALNPAESLENLQAWVEYLNSELEALKAGGGAQQPPIDYSGAEDAFSGQSSPQTQGPQDSSIWNSIKNYINKDVSQQTPRSDIKNNPQVYY